MGRPSKLTEERQKTICDLIRAGNTRECAAGCAGIGRTTFFRWLEENGDFRDAVEKADADAEARNVMIIQKAAQAGTWQAAARWLEARRPRDWQRRERTEVTGVPQEQGGSPLMLVIRPQQEVEDASDS